MPSGNPVLQDIIANIVTTMQAINGTPDYYTAIPIANVFVASHAAMLDNPNIVPCVYVVPQGASIDAPRGGASPYRINQLFSFGMYGKLVLYTNVRSDTMHVQIEQLVRDAHRAFGLDPTRGGLAVDSRITGYEMIYPTDESDAIGGADLSFEVWYRTLRDDLNTPH